MYAIILWLPLVDWDISVYSIRVRISVFINIVNVSKFYCELGAWAAAENITNHYLCPCVAYSEGRKVISVSK